MSDRFHDGRGGQYRYVSLFVIFISYLVHSGSWQFRPVHKVTKLVRQDIIVYCVKGHFQIHICFAYGPSIYIGAEHIPQAENVRHCHVVFSLKLPPIAIDFQSIIDIIESASPHHVVLDGSFMQRHTLIFPYRIRRLADLLCRQEQTKYMFSSSFADVPVSF